jgi:hypothetical protein
MSAMLKSSFAQRAVRPCPRRGDAADISGQRSSDLTRPAPPAQAARPARACTVVVRAQQSTSRRSFLGLVATG